MKKCDQTLKFDLKTLGGIAALGAGFSAVSGGFQQALRAAVEQEAYQQEMEILAKNLDRRLIGVFGIPPNLLEPMQMSNQENENSPEQNPADWAAQTVGPMQNLVASTSRAGIDVAALSRALAEGVARDQVARNVRRNPNPSGKKAHPKTIKNFTLYDTPYFQGLPRYALSKISKLSGYGQLEILDAYHHWWATWYDRFRDEMAPAPIFFDLGFQVICLHYLKKYDPPWVDPGFSEALYRFQELVKQERIADQARNMDLEQLAKGYYEIFLAQCYPDLADPNIRITLLEEPTAKPEATEHPDAGRNPRKIILADILPGEYRKGRRA